jgi:putative Ca2+/H+ antiporter (TMEM165/GDT1 family)
MLRGWFCIALLSVALQSPLIRAGISTPQTDPLTLGHHHEKGGAESPVAPETVPTSSADSSRASDSGAARAAVEAPKAFASASTAKLPIAEFLPAFFASVSMIVVSELGDKTFFIAAIMAMRHNRWTVFGGAIGALAVMTVLSAAMGFALPNLMPRTYTHLASVALFVFFGFRLLVDAYNMESGAPNEELDEVESELEKKEIELATVKMEGGSVKENPSRSSGASSSNARSLPPTSLALRVFSPIFVQCFTMTFLAEWGDRSQIATIALAAVKNPYGVTLGGIIGHALCTGLAVLGGKLLATRISERTVAAVGGVLFFFFAIHGLYTGE